MTKTFTFARPTAIVAGFAALLGASVANAADIINEEPPVPQAVMETAPVAGWAGAYAGATAYYQFNGKARGVVGDDVETDGFAGSGFAGYNWQSGQFVYGAEGDVGYSGADGSNGPNEVEGGLNGTIRARMGVAVTDNVLVYGTAGGAAERQEVSNDLGSDKQTMLGYTVGGGVDAKITEQVFVRGEYRFTDYGDDTFNTGGLAQNVDTKDHKVGLGLGIKF